MDAPNVPVIFLQHYCKVSYRNLVVILSLLEITRLSPKEGVSWHSTQSAYTRRRRSVLGHVPSDQRPVFYSSLGLAFHWIANTLGTVVPALALPYRIANPF